MTEQTKVRGDKPEQGTPAQPVKYAHTVYEEPDNIGRYHQAYAWVGTLEQIAERHAAASTLPYQFEFFGGQDVVTLEDKQLSITSGNGLFEVFDLEQVTQAIPGLTVVYAIDEYEFSTEEQKKIRERTYTLEKLAQHGKPVFNESLLAPGAQCWTHDLEDEPLSFVDYWTSAG